MSSEPDSRHVSGESSAATNPSVNFEPQDVKAETILKYLVMLLLTVFASMLIVWGLYRALTARDARRASYVFPLRQSAGRILPPEPRLQGAPGHQISPQEELRQTRAEAEAALSSYGWVDEKTGIARIPIDEAIKLLAERGLPSTGIGSQKKASPDQTPMPQAKTSEENRP